jgi:hypothetical protein
LAAKKHGERNRAQKAASYNSQVFKDFLVRDNNRMKRQSGIKERIEDAARKDVTKMDAIQKRRAKLAKVALDKRFELQFQRVEDKNKYTKRLRAVTQRLAAEDEKYTQASMLDYISNQEELVARKLIRK